MATSWSSVGCNCLYPSIAYPRKCSCQQQQQLTHETVFEVGRRLQALSIPERFWTQKLISWSQKEALESEIETMRWVTFDKLRRVTPTLQNLPERYGDEVYLQVSQLLQRKHRLQLSPQDKIAFIYGELSESEQEMQIRD